ncbi:MAG: flagellar biosynthesis anti-sigma factor FlgM [Acidobacteriota bacterium]|nr:flagellar biosynthesis anti-sigma factor FlgM [Acidobacteriota bacterium]
MRLQLDANLTGAAEPSRANESGGAVAGNALRSQGGGQQDSVAISDISSVLAHSTADRASRVSQIAAAVRGGTYQVTSAAISRALVAHAGV